MVARKVGAEVSLTAAQAALKARLYRLAGALTMEPEDLREIVREAVVALQPLHVGAGGSRGAEATRDALLGWLEETHGLVEGPDVKLARVRTVAAGELRAARAALAGPALRRLPMQRLVWQARRELARRVVEAAGAGPVAELLSPP